MIPKRVAAFWERGVKTRVKANAVKKINVQTLRISMILEEFKVYAV